MTTITESKKALTILAGCPHGPTEATLVGHDFSRVTLDAASLRELAQLLPWRRP